MDIGKKELEDYRNRAEGFLRWLGASREEAEDVTQESLLAALEYDPQEVPFGALLIAIARNKYINLREKKKTAERLMPKLVASQPRPDDERVRHYLRDFVHAYQRCASLLSPVERDVVELSCFAGLTGPEIAKVLGKPLGTVSSHKKRGIEKLRAMPELQKHRDLLRELV